MRNDGCDAYHRVDPITQEENAAVRWWRARCCVCWMRFMYGCRINLTILRANSRENGLDFNHGTGHGVGYLGCVSARNHPMEVAHIVC